MVSIPQDAPFHLLLNLFMDKDRLVEGICLVTQKMEARELERYIQEQEKCRDTSAELEG